VRETGDRALPGNIGGVRQRKSEARDDATIIAIRDMERAGI
jgi:hypothetical protein